jgi:hypothetical protein
VIARLWLVLLRDKPIAAILLALLVLRCCGGWNARAQSLYPFGAEPPGGHGQSRFDREPSPAAGWTAVFWPDHHRGWEDALVLQHDTTDEIKAWIAPHLILQTFVLSGSSVDGEPGGLEIWEFRIPESKAERPAPWEVRRGWRALTRIFLYPIEVPTRARPVQGRAVIRIYTDGNGGFLLVIANIRKKAL